MARRSHAVALAVLSGVVCLALARPAAAAEIRFLHRAPARVTAGEPFTVEGHMLGASDVESAELVYRQGPNGPWKNFEIELVGGDHYRARLPASEIKPPSLHYYVVALDFVGDRHAAFASLERPAIIEVEAKGGASQSAAAIVATPVAEGTPGGAADLSGAAQPPPAALPPQGASPMASPTLPPSRAADVPNLPGLVTIIDAAEISATGARTLADVLRLIPELELERRVDGHLVAHLRGRQHEGDVVLRFDGQLMNDGYDGEPFFAMPAALIAEVKLSRAAQGSIAGLRGSAGTLDVTSRADTGLTVHVGGGSVVSLRSAADTRYGTYVAHVAGGGEIDGVRLSGGAAAFVTDGTQPRLERDAYSTAGAASAAPGPLRDQDAVVGVRARLDFGDTAAPSFVAAHYFFRERGNNLGLVDTLSPLGDGREHWAVLTGRFEMPLGEGRQLWLRGGADLHQVDEIYQLTPAPLTISDRDGDSRAESFLDGVVEQHERLSIGGSVEGGIDVTLSPGQVLSTGLAIDLRDVPTSILSRNIDAIGANRELAPVEGAPQLLENRLRLQAVLFVEDRWRMHERVDLTVGTRVGYVSNTARFEADKLFEPRVALTVRPGDGFEVEAGYGISTRAPTLRERSDRDPVTLPTTLAQDRALGDPRLGGIACHDVHLDARFTLPATEGQPGLRVNASAYYQRWLGALSELPQLGLGDSLYRGNNHRLGLSVDGSAELGRARLRTALFWQRTWETTPAGDTLLITSVPQAGALVSLAVRLADAVEVGAAARYRGERHSNSRSPLERLRRYTIPGELRIDAQLRSMPLFWGLRLGVAAYNLLDARVEDPVPRPDTTSLLPGEGLSILGFVELDAGGES